MAEGRRAPAPVPGFPELADVAAAWTHLPGPGPEREMRHTAGTWQALIPCDNPACRGGGFDLVSVVQRMVSFQEADRAGILVCSGWEANEPPEASGGIPCVRTIRYRLLLAYRSSSPPAVPGAPPSSALRAPPERHSP